MRNNIKSLSIIVYYVLILHIFVQKIIYCLQVSVFKGFVKCSVIIYAHVLLFSANTMSLKFMNQEMGAIFL